MKKKCFFLLLCCAMSSFLKSADGLDYKKSIVKIFATKQDYNYDEPWKNEKIKRSTATGFIIEGNRIITNAHAVSNHKFLQVRYDGNPEKFNVQLEYISDDYDLAILKFESDSELTNLTPLRFGTLPKLQEKVKVFGYPLGGDKLSITEGIISRIQTHRYVYSQKQFTVLQTDAAINPGNSGGPVLLNDQVIGVAFQGIRGANNIGYIIPSHMVLHFLKDVTDGQYDGIPSLGIQWLSLESKIHKRMLGMKKEERGILIKDVERQSILQGHLRKNDVLLRINDYPLEIDGSIEYRKGERVGYGYILEQKSYGDELKLSFLRAGEKKTLNVVLKKSEKEPVIASFKSHVPPTYYIKSGFIFEKLSINYLNKYTKSFFKKKNTPYQLISLKNNPPKDVDEIIFLVSVLSDESNIGYQELSNIIVKKVNGEAINDMKDFVKAVNQTGFIVIEDADGREIIMDSKIAKQRDAAIQKLYHIPSLYSADLEEVLRSIGH